MACRAAGSQRIKGQGEADVTAVLPARHARRLQRTIPPPPRQPRGAPVFLSLPVLTLRRRLCGRTARRSPLENFGITLLAVRRRHGADKRAGCRAFSKLVAADHFTSNCGGWAMI